jgi:hypothetical protein
VRLVSSKDHTLLYREDFVYGYSFMGARQMPVVIASDNKYRFPGHSDLLKNPEAALDGVKEGVPLLAKRIAADIARFNTVAPTIASVAQTASASAPATVNTESTPTKKN